MRQLATMTTSPPESAPDVRCRAIEISDLAQIVELLCEGFPERSAQFWRDGLKWMTLLPAIADYPRFGLMLEANKAPVGVILMIFAPDMQAGAKALRCNVSSWYVRPDFRAFGALLISRALRHRDVTYINISARPHTHPILLAQNYKIYTSGCFICAPAFSWGFGASVRRYDPARHADRLPSEEARLLTDHQRLNCAALVCEVAGALHPFVFRARRIDKLPFEVMQLVYCRATADFTKYAAPLGRWLLWRLAKPVVLLDADEPMPGVLGYFGANRGRKFYRGPNPPRPNDLSYTETVLFGS